MSYADPDASPITSDFVERLEKLQTRITDTLAGYEKMREKAEPEIVPIVERYIALHRAHDEALSARLARMGEQPNHDGSVFSVVQKAVVATRAAFDSVGVNTLPQVVDGEEKILGLYDEALQHSDVSTDREMLERQRTDLRQLVDETRTMPLA